MLHFSWLFNFPLFYMTLSFSPTFSTVDLASYFAKKENTMRRKFQQAPIITSTYPHPLVSVLLYSALSPVKMDKFSARNRAIASFMHHIHYLTSIQGYHARFLSSFLYNHVFISPFYCGIFPSINTRYISSTLIKSSPDPLSPSSYCPVSFLPFLS